MGRMDNKSVVVTGAAQGIGKGIAVKLAGEGAQVVIADLNGEKAQSTADEIKATGGQAIGVAADVSDRAQVKALVGKTVDTFGKLDVYFNNAGFDKPMDFLDVSEDLFMSIVKINALGTLIGTQEAAKQMIKQGHGGKIINTGSIAGFEGDPDCLPYSVSKFGIRAIIHAGAKALTRKYGITVNGFAPGVVETPLWDQYDKDLMELGRATEVGQAMKEFSANILQGRPAKPEDLAGTALYLASSDSDYITGQMILVDGGMVFV